MNSKTFTVQLIFDDKTRWLFSDIQLAKMLVQLSTNIAAAATSGPRPVAVVATPGGVKISDFDFPRHD